MNHSSIPFSRPPILGTELAYIAEALTAGKLSGDGRFSVRCHRWLDATIAAHKSLLTPSCTAALELAALLCDLGPGDEVIMPSYTFVSTANAVVLRGAVPVFVDVDPATLNITAAAIEAAITPLTRAIFVVHYAGVPCDMDPINSLATAHDLVVVEDAAQAFGSKYKGRHAGSLGSLAAFSFHDTKNTSCGEGGALIVNDDRYVSAAETMREKGTNRSRFLLGEVDKYTWVDIGSSYLPSELQAAFLFAQLEALDIVTADRLATWAHYHDAFAEFEAAGRFRRPIIPQDVEHNAHLYFLMFPDSQERDRFIATMNARAIGCVFHYVPLHSSPAGARYGRTSGSMEATDRAGSCLVRLPLFYGMQGDRERVAEAVRDYCAG